MRIKATIEYEVDPEDYPVSFFFYLEPKDTILRFERNLLIGRLKTPNATIKVEEVQ